MSEIFQPDPGPEPEPAASILPAPEPVTSENKIVSDFYKIVADTLPDVSPEMHKIIVAQAIHETGNFKSAAFLKDNNPFGMNLAVKRDTTAAGVGSTGYAYYKTLSDAVNDLRLWLEYNGIPEHSNPSDYVKAIKEKGYFTDTLKTYQNAVVKHFNANLKYMQ